MPEAEELRLVRRQQVRDGLLNRRQEVERRLHGVSPIRTATAGARSVSASPVPCTNASFAARAVPPRHELHVHRGGVGVAGALAVDEQLLDDAGEELRREPAAAARR